MTNQGSGHWTGQLLVRNLEEKQATRKKHEQTHMQTAAASRQGYVQIIKMIRDKISLRSDKEQTALHAHHSSPTAV